MKKFLTTLAVTALFFANVFADTAVTVYSNGNEVSDKGVIVDGRTLVPVRGIFEYMGYEVSWDSETKTATLTNSEKDITIKLSNGEENFYVNEEAVHPDVPQQIIDGRFMLPLRAVGDAVGADINWDGENKIARIDEKNETTTEVDESIASAFKVEVITNPDEIDDENVNIIEF